MRFLNEWRMRRFIRTLPPVVADAEMIRRAFRRDMGREFNPWSKVDRQLISVGFYHAMGKSLDKLWTP